MTESDTLASSDNNPETLDPIESLCMHCGENGLTRILATKIPHFKEIVVMSFDCEHCGYQNNELKSVGQISEKGVKIVLWVTDAKDLNRQVVKSDYTCTSIPHLEFEIPAKSQKGEITTIEGIIDKSISDLEQDQAERRERTPEMAEKIDQVIGKLRCLKELEKPFEMIFLDYSGNCFIENPSAPSKDKNCCSSCFKRSKQQNQDLGVYSESEDGLLHYPEEGDYTLDDMAGEVLTFNVNCSECNAPCQERMKVINIPYFKDVVIMASVCEACGHKSNTVKSGCGIEPLGVKIQVKVSGRDDFSRDLLKSETCTMEIPELELQVGSTTLSGRFTTVEGIIAAVREQLDKTMTFGSDAKDPEISRRMEDFKLKLDEILQGRREITLILDDPAGNSYVQSLGSSEQECDDKLSIEKYERNFEQNEILGLNDIRVDDY